MKKIVFFVLIMVLFVASAGSAGTVNIKIKGPVGREIHVSSPHASVWNYTESGLVYTLEREAGGKLLFKKGYDMVAEGKFKGEKLTMRTPAGDLFMKLKIRPEKIKLSWDPKGSEWEFKFRPGKIKVMSGGMAYGKVKYYSESGKVKVKDCLGQVAAEIKKQAGLRAAPGAFVLSGISFEKQAFATLLLFLLDK